MNKTVFSLIVVMAVVLITVCNKNPAAPPEIPEGVAILDKTNFSAMTAVAGRISMVDFYGPDIAASRVMDSSVIRMAQRYKGRAVIAKVNFSEDNTIKYHYDIMYVPTFLFLDGGKEVRRLAKTTSEDSLLMIMDSLLARARQ